MSRAVVSERVAVIPDSKPRANLRSPVPFLLLPAGLLIGILIVCSLLVIRVSLGDRNDEWSTWSVAAYSQLANPRYIGIVLDTIWMALASAAITVVVAFPIALYMTRTPSSFMRRLVLIAIMLPMVVSLLVQSFGWVAILGPDGLLNQLLSAITGIERPLTLLFNRTGVLLGLIQTTLPFAVLPIAAALQSIPVELEEAANVLGANRIRTYRHVILPLSLQGILAGGILVFGFNTGAFVVPLLLGGQKVTTIAIVIRDQMGTLFNWPLGAALSVLLVILALGVQATNRLVAPPAQSTGHSK